MSDMLSAQDAKKNNPAIYFGTQTMGCPTVRPDGTIVKVTMLDPRDPGFAAQQDTERRDKRAKNGSAALLAALKRLQTP